MWTEGIPKHFFTKYAVVKFYCQTAQTIDGINTVRHDRRSKQKQAEASRSKQKQVEAKSKYRRQMYKPMYRLWKHILREYSLRRFLPTEHPPPPTPQATNRAEFHRKGRNPIKLKYFIKNRHIQRICQLLEPQSSKKAHVKIKSSRYLYAMVKKQSFWTQPRVSISPCLIL